MKNASLYAVLIGIMISNAVIAMEGQQAYPWYQSHRNPHLRQAVSERWQTTRQMAGRGWERTKEFIKAHKAELAAIAALIGVALSVRAYNQIFEAYGRAGIVLPQIKKNNDKEYRELVLIGITAYAKRLRNMSVKSEFVDTVKNKHRWIYDKYTPNLEHALWNIMGGKRTL